jgi:hypothetical protein
MYIVKKLDYLANLLSIHPITYFQSKFKTTSKSSHDLLNDPKLLKDVGLEVVNKDDDDYVEQVSL